MEKVIFTNTKNQQLIGVLDVPKNVKINEKVPLMVILHGFGSTKETVTSWTHLINELGIATFRFDFSGTGESDGTYADKTISQFLDDTRAALNYCETLSFINQGKIGVAGHSMGATIALLTAAKAPSLSCCIALSPAINPGGVIANFYAEEELQHMGQKGYVEIRKTGEIKKLDEAFFLDAKTYDVLDQAKNISYPFLVISAKDDDIVSFSEVKELCDNVSNAMLTTLPISDHNFSDKWTGSQKIIQSWLTKWMTKK